eukprot:4722672-Lingulodinium_polyedra.AAC.1
MQDKQLLRDVYIGIASLRHSLCLIQAHLPGWVAERLSFCPREGEGFVQQQKQLWNALVAVQAWATAGGRGHVGQAGHDRPDLHSPAVGVE